MQQVPPPPRQRKSSLATCAAEAGRASCSAVVCLPQPMQADIFPRSSRSYRVSHHHHHHLLRSWRKEGMPRWTNGDDMVAWRWAERESCPPCPLYRCRSCCRCGSRRHIGYVFAREAATDGWWRKVCYLRCSSELRVRHLLANMRQSATCLNGLHHGLGRDVKDTPIEQEDGAVYRTAATWATERNTPQEQQGGSHSCVADSGLSAVMGSLSGWFGSASGGCGWKLRRCREFHIVRWLSPKDQRCLAVPWYMMLSRQAYSRHSFSTTYPLVRGQQEGFSVRTTNTRSTE